MPDLTFAELQAQQRPWVQHNFGNRPPWHPLLGAVEELGEISHAVLKHEQKIRGMDDATFIAEVEDGIADAIIFLTDFASSLGIDVQDAIERTWASVKTRDWKADAVGGVTASRSIQSRQ